MQIFVAFTTNDLQLRCSRFQPASVLLLESGAYMQRHHPDDLLEGLLPFSDQLGRTCVQFHHSGGVHCLPLHSPAFLQFYDARHFDMFQSIPGPRRRNDAIRYLESSVHPDHRGVFVSRRIGAGFLPASTVPSTLALDLSTADQQSLVSIDANGWKLAPRVRNI